MSDPSIEESIYENVKRWMINELDNYTTAYELAIVAREHFDIDDIWIDYMAEDIFEVFKKDL